MQIYKKIFIAAKKSPFCLRYLTKNVNNIPSPLGLYSKADTRFIPAKFQLHGKVERRALARTSDDHLYYIETRHPETLCRSKKQK